MRVSILSAVFSLAAPTLVIAEPAPPNAVYYADCLAQAAAARTYDRDGRYLRFTCHGDPAVAFFDALGRRASDVAYEEKRDSTVTRFTSRPVKDTYGIDYCRRDPGPSTEHVFSCVLIYPTGAFFDR